MKKNMALFFELVIGIAMIITGIVLKIDYYSTLIFAGGCGLGCGALVQLIRSAYYNHPSHIAEYERRTHEEHIKKVDERSQFLRAKAGYNTYVIMLFVFIILDTVLAILQVNPRIILIVALLFIAQCLIYIVSYHFFEKKM